MSSSKRLTDLFHVLKVIKRTVSESERLASDVLQHGAADRARVAALLKASQAPGREAPPFASIGELSGAMKSMFDAGVEFHGLCQRLLTQRDALATQLETIRKTLSTADLIVPRRENLGRASRARAPQKQE